MADSLDPMPDQSTLRLRCEMQRDFSAASDPCELAMRFVRRVREMAPVERLLYIKPWPPAVREFAWMSSSSVATGAEGYRVLLDLPGDSNDVIDREAIDALFAPEKPCAADARGGLLERILGSDSPLLMRRPELGPDDPIFQASPPVELVAVPVYWKGHVQSWIVVTSAETGAFDGAAMESLLTMGNMLVRGAVYLSAMEDAERTRERLQATVDEIGRVQRHLLAVEENDDPRIEFVSSCQPCEAAGGDYFAYARFPDGQFRMVVADVSGHGTVASVSMAVLRTAVRAFRAYGVPPSEVVPAINAIMRESLEPGVFVTAFFVRLDPESGDGQYANAGHPPALLRRADGTIESLDADGDLPLGVLESLQNRGGSFQMKPGDLLVMYTDGITEAFGPDRELFGVDRLRRAVDQGGGDPENTRRAILGAVRAHSDDADPSDDQTLLLVGFCGPRGELAAE